MLDLTVHTGASGKLQLSCNSSIAVSNWVSFLLVRLKKAH